MNKIIVLSDTHGDNKIINKILDENEYDYAIIAGDYTCDPSFINKRFQFVVKGNNDFDNNKDEIFFEIDGISFCLQHGHLIGSYPQLDDYNFMKKVLYEKNVDILIHGHTHISKIFEYEKGLVINPGSTTYPRGRSKKSYAIIVIDNKNVSCDIINIKE